MGLDDLRSRAEGGSVAAQAVVGISYLHGYDVPRDTAQALLWLTRATEGGASRAAAWLGTMYESGVDVPVDVQRARELYEGSAQRGEFLVCIFLARLLASGKLGSPNEGGAARWYREALGMNVDACPELDEAKRYLAFKRRAPEQ